MAERVKRYDYYSPPADALRKPERTAAGFLRVDGYMSRTGVQLYTLPDGGVRRELRLPEEVFADAAIASFRQMPVTNLHPPGMITPETAARYTVGAVGDEVRREGDWAAAAFTVYDRDAIRCIEAGRVQLSCGYECELEMTPGEYQGEKYDAIQRKIVGNHLALVDRARAGEDARIRLDGGSARMLPFGGETTPPNPQEAPAMGMILKIDGVEYEVSEGNQRACQAAVDRQAERLRADIAAVQKKADSAAEAWEASEKQAKNLASAWDALKARKDSRRDEKQKCDECGGTGKVDAVGGSGPAKCDGCDGTGYMKDADPDGDDDEMCDSATAMKGDGKRLDAAAAQRKRQERQARRDASIERRIGRRVAARVALEVEARKHLGPAAKLDGKTDLEVRKAVVLMLQPSAKLDGQSEAYVQARYDAALEAAGEPISAADKARAGADPAQVAAAAAAQARKDGKPSKDPAQARRDYIDRMQNAYKGEPAATK